MPEDWFFPTRQSQLEISKAVCHGCPVRYECLKDAESQGGAAYGIWGGYYFRNGNKKTRLNPGRPSNKDKQNEPKT